MIVQHISKLNERKKSESVVVLCKPLESRMLGKMLSNQLTRVEKGDPIFADWDFSTVDTNMTQLARFSEISDEKSTTWLCNG